MNLIEVRAPDAGTLSVAVSFVESATIGGATSVSVANTQGFLSGDQVAVGVLFSDDCEGASLTGAPSSGALPVTALALGHKRGVPVTKLRYNYYRVWRDTSRTGTFTTEVGVVGGQPFVLDQPETYFTDSSGTSDHWYKVTLKNSVSGLETGVGDAEAFKPNSVIAFDPQVLRRDYLMGVRQIDYYGNVLRDSTLNRALLRAIARVETYLGINIAAMDIESEKHDYYAEDYVKWSFIKLDRHPIISVSEVRLQFPENSTPITFPSEWIQVDKNPGMINMIPTYGSISQWLVGQSIALPLLASRIEYIPHVWRVDYRAGFEPENTPADIQDVIYKQAAISLITILADTIFGPGVASQSLGIDGLSQSKGTVANAMYNAFASRVSGFEKDIADMLPRIKKRYLGIRMQVM